MEFFQRIFLFLNRNKSNVDPEGDLFFAMPNISFSGGVSIGLTVGVGLPFGLNASATGGYNFSANKTFGSIGLNAGINIGGFNVGASLSYGSGGASAGVGLGVSDGKFGIGLGGVNYSSSGIGFSGPSASYALSLGKSQEYTEEGQLGDLNDPVDYNQANADKYAQLGYGDTPSYTKLIADGTLSPTLKAKGSTIDANGIVFNSKGEETITRGSTAPSKTFGKTNSTIFLYKRAFTSKGQLLSTIGHELYHARLFNAGIHNSVRHHASISIWLARTNKILGVGRSQSKLYWNYKLANGQHAFRNSFNMGDLRYQPNLLLEPIRP